MLGFEPLTIKTKIMGREAEVALFLKTFKEKMKIWNVLFRDDRGKNAEYKMNYPLK